MEEIKPIVRHSIFREIKKQFPDVKHDSPQPNPSLEEALSALKSSSHPVTRVKSQWPVPDSNLL